ncbi:uncharacterized protein Z518_06626 [Rhinocladiella mackenziei CBS 650.93]|uniref:Uncharacterized protein n=1 Tax=Rhinocladiella mackenziei CBS 650.93 TaxID=1442369 RepID=A0A0D2IIG0_9EURO|nr:uncharacterized protein Z518_06626 [Rhinocladiella mackenziei CBS 650.93]KIX03076.1 hypothetical protein Z518_06626 [Rhinocladiella mackenziei CBS 650.93]
MARNKEDNPLSTTQRHGSIASLTKNLPSEDFFTDSILDESHIPSPISQKTRPVKPRRAFGTNRALQVTKDSGNKSSGSSLAEYTAARSNRHLKPSSPLTRKKSPSPLRTNGLTTPPQSRNGPKLTSPTSEFSSPPGGLTESYQRIADEEDLAATEREFRSDEDDIDDDPQDALEVDIDANPPEKEAVKGSPPQTRTSQESTPVQLPIDAEKENLLDSCIETASEPSTLDFIRNEMTDRVLAAKLTPHVIDRAKDHARLERLRQSRIPIDFGNSPRADRDRPSKNYARNDIASVSNRGPITFDNALALGPNGVPKAFSDTSTESTPQKRVKAFSRATRNGIHKSVPEEEDDSDTPPDLQKRERIVAFSKADRRRTQLTEALHSQMPSQPPKLIAFSRANGRSRPYGALYEGNENRQDQTGHSSESVASAESEPISMAASHLEENLQAARSFLAKWRQETAEKRAVKSPKGAVNDSAQIDWAATAADVPLPSVEESSTPRDTPPRDAWPSSIQKQRSIDRIRKWENDFTGLSFQVSESPPIRSRPNLNDTLREREMENLAKQAVTTNRLDEIREKDPNVIVRKTSRSFGPEDRRQTPPEAHENQVKTQQSESLDRGEPVPDAAGVVYTSSSNGAEKSKPSQRQISESQNSLDHLQRLARAVSITPRASTVSQGLVRETEEDSTIDNLAPNPFSEDDDRAPPSRGPQISARNHQVVETPKVVGAWTDTILSETVKAENKQQRVPSYMQTPQVNAGAWIDTPFPNGSRTSVPLPMTVEEVTEELTNGHIEENDENANRGHADEANQSEIFSPEQTEAEPKPAAENPVVLPPSALTNVLNEAKQKRLVSRDLTDVRDDTLNLGDGTIQSFEDLLMDAADITADLTSLIKAGAEDEVMEQKRLAREGNDGDPATAEVAFIGHLTSRMERLMSNLHEARKGISRLEQKVSQTPPPSDEQAQLQALIASPDPGQPCMVCGRSDEPHLHKHDIDTNAFFPMSYSTFTIPIPLLFHPRRQDRYQLLPHPTWLGWFTIAIWTWYIAECTMCEIYSRPLFAERYMWPIQPEPEFPFVLPTMLWRWTHFDMLALGILGNFWRLLVAVYRIIGMGLGLSDGFVDDKAAATGLAEATKSALNAAKSLVPGGGEGADWSMMNDEFI